MVCGDFKYLTRGTVSDKILSAKAFDIAKDPKYDEYQRGRFDKKLVVVVLKMKTFIIKN